MELGDTPSLCAPDVKNYSGCLHRVQNHMKKNLNTVYPGFDFVDQDGASKWEQEVRLVFKDGLRNKFPKVSRVCQRSECGG